MKAQEILHQRLANQQIGNSSCSTPAELVSWMGAVQAQDYAMAQWALGLRLGQATESLIEKSITHGEILRTHILRPTWHFVTPADIRWMLQLTAPRIHTYMRTYNRKLELDDAIFRKSLKVLEKILRDGNALNREEIALSLNSARINTESLRLNHILVYAELEGLICSGPKKGKQITYALLEERVPPVAALTKEESLYELALRYFQSHGPASLKDFTWWSGLSVTDARQAQELIGEKLEWVTLGSESLAFIERERHPLKKNTGIILLPNYDEYLVSYADRTAMLGKGINTLSRDGNPIFANTIIINGKVEGSWKRTVKTNSVVIHTDPFIQLTSSQEKQIEHASQQFRRFLEK